MTKKRIVLLIIIIIIGFISIRHFNPNEKIVYKYETVFIEDLDVPLFNQHPKYPTGCESVALYMLLKYYGVDVTVEDIINSLPKGPLPYEENGALLGGNPEREFIGDPRSSSSYGVFNEPIRDVANKYLSGAVSMKNADINDIKKSLSKGNPVIAWFTTDINKGIEYISGWYDYESKEYISWPSHEHAIVIYKIDDKYVYYNDPNTGGRSCVSISVFNKIFEQIEGRIVYYNK